jgi:hypothetical protein
VDVSQILKIASGVNPVSAGYLQVTTSGLVQVDLDGGGNNWTTLSSINGTGAVSVRYLSGGAAATVSVARVADSSLTMTASAQTIEYGSDSNSPAPSQDQWSAGHHLFHEDLVSGSDLSPHLYDILPFG